MDHGFIYKVRESEIYVRNRPKCLTIGEAEYKNPKKQKVAAVDQADAYLSVTDSFCIAPPGKQYMWFPWNEGRQPIAEMFYATNKTLNWWTHYMKLKKIQVFCDGGTHRSVTVFGAFLMTYFTRAEYDQIIKDRVPVNYEPKHHHTAHPMDYLESYLKTFPSDRLLFQAMREDYMGRLDNHCRNIFDQVKERYADNK
jgi:hypothetical protein